jgi:hypothetical protein
VVVVISTRNRSGAVGGISAVQLGGFGVGIEVGRRVGDGCGGVIVVPGVTDGTTVGVIAPVGVGEGVFVGDGVRVGLGVGVFVGVGGILDAWKRSQVKSTGELVVPVLVRECNPTTPGPCNAAFESVTVYCQLAGSVVVLFQAFILIVVGLAPSTCILMFVNCP